MSAVTTEDLSPATRMFAAYENRLNRRRVSKAAMREFRLTSQAFIRWLAERGMGVEDVRRRHIEEFFSESGWAPTTQRARLTYIRGPYKYAVHELEMLPKSPFDGMQVELERPAETEPKVISNRELREIKAGIDDHSNWVTFHLLAYTGMRGYEIRGLLWENVSFADQTLTVLGKGNKTRTIPLHPALQEVLAEYGVFAGTRKSDRYKPSTRAASPYVLPGQGGMLTRNGFWSKVSMRVAKGHDVAPHDFRRTFISSLQANGAVEAAVKQIVGHSRGGDITYGVYTRLPQQILYREILKVYADDPI